MGRLLQFFCAAVAALVWLQSPARADYPTTAVKIIVANTAGTAGDNLVRIIAARASEMVGKQFYVSNHPGAGGTIGAELAARAPADGYTILQNSTPLQVIAPHLYKNLKYKPMEDFAPLIMFAKTENVMVVHPAFQAKTVQDVIAYAKANPGKLKMANAGIGFQSHISNVMFANQAGIEVMHVAYRGAASMTSVMGGETDVTIAPLPAVIGFIRSGRVRAVAGTGLERSSLLPDLPTIHESGVAGFNANGWNGMMLPKGVPPAIVARLTEIFSKVLAEEPIKEQIRRGGAEPWALAGEAMGKFIREEYERYGEVIRAGKITLE